MAKATAECTCRVCGKQFEKIASKRNRRDADSWEKWAVSYYDTCDDCLDKQHAQEAAELAKQAKEDGLPALYGTAKQVVWAEQIRAQLIADIHAVLDKMDAEISKETDEARRAYMLESRRIADLAYENIAAESSANFWIEHRDDKALNLLKRVAREKDIADKDSKKISEIEEEATIVPENQTKGTATIKLLDEDVMAIYPKDDDFRQIVKESGYSWNSGMGGWMRGINQFTGTAKDRAAELANKLLRAGFSVTCLDNDVRRMAVDASYEPECTRWVSYVVSGSYAGWLSVKVGRNHSLYEAALKIKGARYSSGSVMVPVANWKLVMDFADMYEYKLSTGAKKAIEQRKIPVSVASPKKVEHADHLAEILNSSDAILEDLKDD